MTKKKYSHTWVYNHAAHIFPVAYESLLEEDDSFCNYITLKASPGESRIHSVKNGMLLLSEDVFQVRIKEFPGLFPKRLTTSTNDTSGAAVTRFVHQTHSIPLPDSPSVAAIKAYCEGWLLRAVARVELILFIINISLQTIYPHRQRSRKHRYSKYTHRTGQFTCGGFSGGLKSRLIGIENICSAVRRVCSILKWSSLAKHFLGLGACDMRRTNEWRR